MIKRNGESLCDRLMTLFQRYQSAGRRVGLDFGFMKWICLNQLREMPLSAEKKFLLNAYNTQEEGRRRKSVQKVKIDNRKKWPTEKDAYDHIMKLYAKEVMKYTYWGGDSEIALLSQALHPLVELVVFVLPNEHEIKGKHRRGNKLIKGPKLTQPRLYHHVHRDRKPASVLFLLHTDGNHYELLSLRRRRKDFLVLADDIPEYMFE